MDVIAERELTIISGGIPLETVVRVGRPIPDESGENWLCPYEVQVQDKCKAFRMHGIDSMQALVLTLKILDVELEVEAKNLNGQLQWLGEAFSSVFNP